MAIQHVLAKIKFPNCSNASLLCAAYWSRVCKYRELTLPHECVINLQNLESNASASLIFATS